MEIPVWIDLFTIIGIVLEIFGFWWFLRYGRTPKSSELSSWLKKNGYSDFWQAEGKLKIVDWHLDYDTTQQKDVLSGIPLEFKEYWTNRRRWAIILVIIGLGAQIAQVAISDSLRILCPMRIVC